MFFSNSLSLSSFERWQFDLWFVCLVYTQLMHLEVLGSHIADASRILNMTLLACEISTIA